MTLASDTKRVRRETAAHYRYLPLVIEVGATSLRIRPKGKRLYYEVDFESIYSLGAKKEAERIRAEKKAARKRNGK